MKNLLKCKSFAKILVDVISSVIDKECKAVARKKNESVLRVTSDSLRSFKLQSVVEEAKQKCPVSWGILEVIAGGQKKEFTDLQIATAYSVLMKNRNDRMNGFQKRMSVLFYNANVCTKVS